MNVVGLKRKVSLALVSTVLTFALGEGLARVVLPLPQTVEVLPVGATERLRREQVEPVSDAVWRMPDGARMMVQTPTGLRLRANARTVIRDHRLGGRDIELRTNELGFRGPPLSQPKVHPRVLFLGDSITWGDYLQESETYVSLVQAESVTAGKPIETVNAGIGSAGLRDYVGILRETGWLAEPDVVIVAFYLNDFQTSPGVWIRQPPPLLRHSRLAGHLFSLLGSRKNEQAAEPSEQQLRSWRQDLARRLSPGDGVPVVDTAAFHREILSAFGDWGGAWSPQLWSEVFEPLLTDLVRQVRLHDKRLLVVCFPVAAQVMARQVRDYPQRRLAAFMRRFDVPVLDLLPAHRRAAQASTTPLFYDHCHHTPHGSRVVADAIWAFLRDRGVG